MADKKPEPPSENGHSLMWQVFGLVIIIMILGTILARHGLDDRIDDYTESIMAEDLLEDGQINGQADGGTKGKSSLLGLLLPRGEIEVGEEVSNRTEVVVRDEPGGSILGSQKARLKARVLEGPVAAFGKNWWLLDYQRAPDGWVWDGNISSYTGFFGFLNFFPRTFEILKPFFIFLGIVLAVLILFVMLKMSDLKKQIKKKNQYIAEHERIQHRSDSAEDSESTVSGIEIANLPTGETTGQAAPKTADVKNRRWSNVQSLINSHSVNDWRQAIIEADIILDEMLDKMGYHGDGVGDKLKQVEPSDFITLDRAWEAHKIRNRIAHKGTSHALSRDEAERAIKLYEQVFEEFYYV